MGVWGKIGIESGMVIGGEAESADVWVEFLLSAGRKKLAGSVCTDRCGNVCLIQFMVFGQSWGFIVVLLSSALVDDSKEEVVELCCDCAGCVWAVVGWFVGGLGMWMVGPSNWGARKSKLMGFSSLSEYSSSLKPLLHLGGRYSFSLCLMNLWSWFMTVVFHWLKMDNVMGSFVTLMVVMWVFLRFEYVLTSSIWMRARLVLLAGTSSDFSFSWELGRPVLCTQLQNFSIQIIFGCSP